MRTLMAVAALALLASGAQARDLPAGGMTINEVADWLKAAGYRADIQTSDGRQNIYSSSDGFNFHIGFYDCKADRCGSLQFYVGFSTKGAFTTEKMNQWSKENRWARAYIDSSNDPWVEYDVDLTPGGTYEMLDDEFVIWRDSLRHFHQFTNL